MTVFSSAVDALFEDENLAHAAVYRQRASGTGLAVRVMRRSPDEILRFGEGRFAVDTVMIHVRTSEVAQVQSGDTFEIAGEMFEVRGEPRRDSERFVWMCEARAL